jgi:hypothetical protein
MKRRNEAATLRRDTKWLLSPTVVPRWGITVRRRRRRRRRRIMTLRRWQEVDPHPAAQRQ